MGRHLVCADLHGMYGLWEQIRNDLQPDDTLYFLGDAIDRGPDGWKIMSEMINNPFINVQYICGNHEDMMVEAMFGNGDYDLWFQNGGRVTFSAVRKAMAESKSFVETTMEEIIKLPTIYTYTNANDKTFVLTHAGFTPKGLDKDGNIKVDLSDNDLIWDRSHFFAPWPEGLDNIYIIHGHTPIPYLIEDLEQYAHFSGEGELEFTWEDEASPWFYADGHKIDIDCLSVVTGNTIVFDLDTETYTPYLGEGIIK